MKTRSFRPVLATSLFILSATAIAPVSRADNPAAAASASTHAVPVNHPAPMNGEIASRLSHLTLDDAIDIALHRNPQILTQLQEIQRNYGILITARAAALPQLVAAGTFTQTDRALLETNSSRSTSGSSTSTSASAAAIPAFLSGFTAAGAPTTVPTNTLFKALFSGSNQTEASRNFQVTLQVQQTLYNAAIPPAIRQAKFLRDAAYYALRETVDTTINTVKTDFYSVLFDQANIANQEENLRLLQSQLTDQQNRFAAGTVPRFDVLQASVAVGVQRPNVITAENNFRLGYIGLARTLGIEYGPAQEREAPLKLVGNLDYHPQNFNADAGVAAGKANRGVLKQLRLNILSDIESIRVQAAGYQPVFVADAGIESRSNALSDDIGQTLEGWFFGGQFNWNIFDGGATYGRVKQAKAALRETRIQYEDTVNSVVEEIQSNYLNIQQNKELVASQVLNVSEAEEAVRLSQARLSAGAGTQLDVLQSQQQLLAAQTTELQARFNYAVALANYERVTGTSTVYDEAFNDPLTSASRPNGADTTGAASGAKTLPAGTVKTPDVQKRGSGKPLPEKIDASTNSGKPRKAVRDRSYLFDDR